MNQRRLSFGLLATLAAAMMIGCGETPPADAPPQPTAAPAETAAAVTATATAEPAPPPPPAEPPPPPAKPAKEKFVGKFTQEFAGELSSIAEAAAKKAGGAKGDQKKIDAALEKSKKNFTDNDSKIETTGDTITWMVKGKAAHTIKYEVAKGDDTNLTLKLGKDGKKDLKGQEVMVTFKDDNSFEMSDPFPKGKSAPMKLVFKRQ